MKLAEYVRQTLLDITNGVQQAQRESLLFIALGSTNGERFAQAQVAPGLGARQLPLPLEGRG